MRMTLTVTPKGVALAVIAVLVIIALIYIIVLIRKLIESLKKLDGVLDDAKSMTEITSARVEQVDGIVSGIGDVVGQTVNAIAGNQSTVNAATHIVDAGSSLVGIFKKKSKVEDAPEPETKKSKKAKKPRKPRITVTTNKSRAKAKAAAEAQKAESQKSETK
jgi:3-methyladenine DNA glycosylase/8-oxoguanine DNA glycosylase